MSSEDIIDKITQFLVMCCCLKILNVSMIFNVCVVMVYVFGFWAFLAAESERE